MTGVVVVVSAVTYLLLLKYCNSVYFIFFNIDFYLCNIDEYSNIKDTTMDCNGGTNVPMALQIWDKKFK